MATLAVHVGKYFDSQPRQDWAPHCPLAGEAAGAVDAEARKLLLI